MLKWQRLARASMLTDKMMLTPQPVPLFDTAPDGWCYLYVFQSGTNVKIGRSVNPRLRLQQIQSSQADPVEFIVAVPTHADFEPIVHQYFADACAHGEWYTLTDELGNFIEWLQSGRNPLAWLWHRSVHRPDKTRKITTRER
jgi:hypothetical protein